MSPSRLAYAAILTLVLQACASTPNEWEQTRQRDTVEAYEAFLLANPQSEHANQVHQRIKALEWERASKLNTPQSYQDFIQAYPKDPLSLEAQSRLELFHWEKARELNTKEGYQEFLEAHPRGKHASEAHGQIAQLDWLKTQELNTFGAYLAFVKTYPRSRFVEEANRKASVLAPDAFRTAAANGDAALVQAMLEMGVDVESKSENGTTALMWAALKGHEDIVDLLLLKGAQINQRTAEGLTALMLAAQEGHGPVVSRLLQDNPDVTLRNTAGDTAMDLAARKGDVDILNTLLRKAMPAEGTPGSVQPMDLPPNPLIVNGIEEVVRKATKDISSDKEMDVNILAISNYDTTNQLFLVFAKVAIVDVDKRYDLGFIRHFRLRPVADGNWKLEMMTRTSRPAKSNPGAKP